MTYTDSWNSKNGSWGLWNILWILTCMLSKLACYGKTTIHLVTNKSEMLLCFCFWHFNLKLTMFWHWQNVASFTCMFGFPSTMSCLRFGRFFTKSMESILFSEMSSVSKVFKVTSGNVVRLLQDKSRVLIFFMCFRMSAGKSFRP